MTINYTIKGKVIISM